MKKHLPNIEIYSIPHQEQRYDTAGDYDEDSVGWWINVSQMTHWEYEALVAVHELVEMILTKHRKISWDKITKFDETDGKDSDDPGTMKSAPYHREHMFSMKIEKLLCKELGLDWDTYDKSFKKLKYK
jgi:hypothetical protein